MHEGPSRWRALTQAFAFDILAARVSTFAKQVAGSERPGSLPAAKSGPDDLLPLARMAAEGNPDAAATLIVHVAGPMLKVVRKVLGRHHPDVDDVAQDAVIALLEALTTFRGECSVTHFARRVALLATLTASRRATARHQRQYDPNVTLEDLPGESSSPLATTLSSRRREQVRHLLSELPDVLAESLAMHFVLGYTVEEIAVAISVSPSTVWSRLRQGKRALRRRLESDSSLAELLELWP